MRQRKKCPICGEMFTPHAPNARYCSDTCRMEAKRKTKEMHTIIRYQRLKSAGLCTVCKAPVVPGKTRCGRCLEIAVVKNRERRKEMRKRRERGEAEA